MLTKERRWGGGGGVGYSGPLYDFSSPCIYKLITGSHFPLNSNDCLQINDIAALAPVVLMLFGKVEEDRGCQSKSEGYNTDKGNKALI